MHIPPATATPSDGDTGKTVADGSVTIGAKHQEVRGLSLDDVHFPRLTITNDVSEITFRNDRPGD